MAPSDSSQQNLLGDETDWPPFNLFRLLAAGAAAIGFVLATIEFLFPSLSDAGSSDRRWQIIGGLALAALVCAAWPWIKAAKRRIQNYGQVKTTALEQRREIDRMSSIVESSNSQKIQDDILITTLQAENSSLGQGMRQLSDSVEQTNNKNRSLVDLITSFQMVLSLLDRVEVVRAVAIGDEVFLAVEPSTDVQLNSGDEIVVIDGDTGEPLGIFLCSQASSESAWFAKEDQIYASLWWGYMRTTADTRAVPTIRTIGLVNRRKVRQDA